VRKFFIFSIALFYLIFNLFILPIFAQVTTTVSVPPRQQDLQIKLELLNNLSDYPQNTTLTYRLTYGSYLPYNASTKVEVSWTQGTIEGDNSPSIDILDYVVGSAENGIQSTTPVVDTINRKITWNFSSFPANSTNNTLTLKLKTNSSYQGEEKVNFTANAKITVSSTTVTESESNDYLYDSSILPTSTPTSTPTPTTSQTNTPTSQTNTPTPTPTPITISFEIKNVEIRRISNNSASIFIEMSKRSRAMVTYGSTINLGNSQASSQYLLSQLINLDNLTPNTDYFFRILAVSEQGEQLRSDYFTFKTALSPSSTKVDLNSIVVVSGNNVIFDNLGRDATSSAQNVVIIPRNTAFQFKLSMTETKTVNDIKLLFRKLSGQTILGLNNLNFQANAASISLSEVGNGVYSVALSSNLEPGVYQLIASYIDDVGNLVEQDIAILKITNPFTVLDKNGGPIEGARVFLYIYSEAQKSYIPLSSSFLNIENPLFTDLNGIVDLVLPKGKYKADVADIRYSDKTVEFEILQDIKSGYPVVYLEDSPLSIVNVTKYYWRGFREVFLVSTAGYLASLQKSVRFFDLITALTMGLLVIITLYAFLRKNNISHLPSYFAYLLHHFLNTKSKDKYIKGVIKEHSGSPVVGAHVYLINNQNQEVENSTLTNRNGEFFFKRGDDTYYLVAMKKGYHSSSQIEGQDKGFIIYEMDKKDEGSKKLIEYSKKTFGGILAFSFEAMLIISLFFLLIFVNYFGFVKTAPFIAISAFNILVWVMHFRHSRHHPTRII
jgi:hypothetical protein